MITLTSGRSIELSPTCHAKRRSTTHNKTDERTDETAQKQTAHFGDEEAVELGVELEVFEQLQALAVTRPKTDTGPGLVTLGRSMNRARKLTLRE